MRISRVIEGSQTAAMLVGSDRIARSPGGVTIALETAARGWYLVGPPQTAPASTGSSHALGSSRTNSDTCDVRRATCSAHVAREHASTSHVSTSHRTWHVAALARVPGPCAVPSYDDLTPSIPDVHPRDTFDQVTRLVPLGGPVVQRRALVLTRQGRGLFACLRWKTSGRTSALARDFSPRIERYGEDVHRARYRGPGAVARRCGRDRERAAAHGGGARHQRIDRGGADANGGTAARAANVEMTVVTGDVAAAVAPVPLEVLADWRRLSEGRYVGVPKVFDILRRWGLRTIGEFAALPAERGGGAVRPGRAWRCSDWRAESIPGR